MLKKLILWVGYATSLLLIIYITFPWWATYVVEKNIPPTWKINQLNIDYPSFKSLSATNLEITHAQFQLKVDDISFDFWSKQLDAANVDLQLPSDDSSATKKLTINHDIKLPRFDISALLKAIPVQALSIKQLKLEKANADSLASTWQFKNVNATRPNSTQLNFDTQIVFQKDTQNTANINLILKQQTSNLTQLHINYAQQSIAQLSYTLNEANQKLQVTLAWEELNKIESFHQLLTNQLPDSILAGNTLSQVQLNAPITLSFEQNREQTSSQLSIDYQDTLYFSKFAFAPWLAEHPINLQLTLSNRSEQHPLQLTGAITLTSDATISVTPELSFEQAQFSLQTLINIGQKTLSFEQIQWDAQFAQLNYQLQHSPASKQAKAPQQAKPTFINAKLPRISGNFSDFNLSNYRQLKPESQITINTPQFSVSQLPAPQPIVKSQLSATSKVNLNQSIEAVLQSNSSIKQAIELNGNLNLTNIELPEQLNSPINAIALNFTQLGSDLNKGNLKVNIQDDANKIQNFKYETLASQITAVIKQQKLNASGKIDINQKTLTTLNAKLDLNTLNGQITLPTQATQTQLINQFLRQLELPKSLALSISAEKIEHQATLPITRVAELNGNLNIQDARLNIGENRLMNTQVNAHLNKLQPLQLKVNLTSNSLDLKSGLQIHDLGVNLTTDNKNSLRLSDLELKIFHGQLKAPLIHLLDQKIQPTQVSLKQLSLKELIEFLKVDGLEATGVLDLNLPLQGELQNITVSNAEFHSTQQGVIRYQLANKDLKKSNIALQALDNFHYQTLDGNLNYDNQGNYHIKLHLLGANPELYNGYPIDFTVNLKGILPDVFKSLFLTGSFQEAIIHQLQSEKQPQQPAKQLTKEKIVE